MLKSVTLLGSASGRNAGDAALIAGIMEAVDAACHRRLLYEIPTIKPSFIWESYENRVRPVSVMPWNLSLKLLGLPTFQSVRRSDLSLIFDAILFDRSLYNPMFNFLSSLYLLAPIAKRKGRKMGFYNVTAGPVRTERGKLMLRDLAERMDFITVRDEDSYHILREIGVQNPRIKVTADAALNVSGCSRERAEQIFTGLGLDLRRETLAVNVNAYIDTWSGKQGPALTHDEFVSTFAAGVQDAMKDSDVQILVVATQHHDVEISRRIARQLEPKFKTAILSNRQYNHHEIKGVLGLTSLLFAMRLHAIILASSALTPVCGLAYLPKLNHYFNTLSMPDHCLNFEHFGRDSIAEHVRRCWNTRPQTRTRFEEAIPRLQRKALEAAEIVAALDRGEDIDRYFATTREEAQIPA